MFIKRLSDRRIFEFLTWHKNYINKKYSFYIDDDFKRANHVLITVKNDDEPNKVIEMIMLEDFTTNKGDDFSNDWCKYVYEIFKNEYLQEYLKNFSKTTEYIFGRDIWDLTKREKVNTSNIQALIGLIELELKEGVTKEQAKKSLMNAGIIDENGKLAYPYRPKD